MKIWPCNEKPKDLTLDEALSAEGIYRPSGGVSCSDGRLIVLKDESHRCYLWKSGLSEMLMPFKPEQWKGYNFIRTTERLCLEIKE